MEKRRLGTTDLQITPIGIGCFALGGGSWRFAMGDQDDRRSRDAIARALDFGVNWIDTAPAYGLGHAEEVVADAIEARSPRPLVFTKCSRVWNERGELRGDLSRASLRKELEDSLRRLRTSHIDLYQVHQPYPDEDLERGWEALAELRAEGLVRHIGVSNFNVDQLRRIQAVAPIDTIQPRYSLIDRSIETGVLPFAQQHGIGVIVYSPMGTGLLTGAMTRERIAALPANDWRRTHPDFNDPSLARNLAIAERLRSIADRHGSTPGAIAAGWTLRHPGVSGAIVGFRHPGQAEQILGQGAFELSDEEAAEIERLLDAWPPETATDGRLVMPTHR